MRFRLQSARESSAAGKQFPNFLNDVAYDVGESKVAEYIPDVHDLHQPSAGSPSSDENRFCPLDTESTRNKLLYKNLTYLDLHATQLGDAGLAHLKDCQTLTNLNLVDTQVSDAGLERLSVLAKLGSVNVIRTKVTEAAVKKFSAALPGCEIEWGGGVIEGSQK